MMGMGVLDKNTIHEFVDATVKVSQKTSRK